MGVPKISVDRFDTRALRQARRALEALGASNGRRVTLDLDEDLAKVLRGFMQVVVETGGVAYGPIASDVTPEQAGKLLGVSRPLVIRRMEDGRLPFRYVGAHRRCALKDVLELKEREEKQDALMRHMHEELDALDVDRRP
jgi:excisionase family DNA binding protein